MKLDIHIVFMLTHALNIHVLPVNITAPSVPVTVHYKDQNVFHSFWVQGSTQGGPAGLQHSKPPKPKFKKQGFLNIMSKVLRDIPFR
jgi:hypothetical protein